MGNFDESKHGRDAHGKFSAGGGGLKTWAAHLEAYRALKAAKGDKAEAHDHLDKATSHADQAGSAWDSQKYPRSDKGDFYKSEKKRQKAYDDETRRINDKREAASEEDWRGPKPDPAAERRAEAGRGPGYTPPDPRSRRSRRRHINTGSDSY